MEPNKIPIVKEIKTATKPTNNETRTPMINLLKISRPKNSASQAKEAGFLKAQLVKNQTFHDKIAEIQSSGKSID